MKGKPLLIREKDSLEKVEKVVKPPQKPTINRALSLGDMTPFLERRPKINPKSKQPTTFTKNVAQGNE